MIQHRINNPVGRNSGYAGVELRIGREDFIAWFMPRDYAGCSVDRVKVEGHYEIGNIEVIPMPINAIKDRMKAKDGQCECYSCHEIKPLNEFVKDKRRKTGHGTICLVCERERTRGRPRRKS
jgi:hypothetical protein